jgi:hypothetical protein
VLILALCQAISILYIDLAMKLKKVAPLFRYTFSESRSETGDMAVKSFSEHWLSDKPKPKFVIPDNASSFTSKAFAEFCAHVGIALGHPAEKEPWAHGVVESAIGHLKDTATVIQSEHPDWEPEGTLTMACSAINSTEVEKGFTVFQ